MQRNEGQKKTSANPPSHVHSYKSPLPMIRENWQLVTDEQVEFEKKPVEVQDYCRKTIDHFWGIYRIYPNSIMRRMWTCNRLDLQPLGSQPVMPKNLPNHWYRWICKYVNVYLQNNATLANIEWGVINYRRSIYILKQTWFIFSIHRVFKNMCRSSLYRVAAGGGGGVSVRMDGWMRNPHSMRQGWLSICPPTSLFIN